VAKTKVSSKPTRRTTAASIRTTVPSVSAKTSAETISILQERLVSLLDLQLTLKHIHWNVVGMNFIAIHQMLDVQVDAVRAMSDAVAERVATMGGEPKGTPGAITAVRTWGDYELDRAPTVQHLMALDHVYSGVIEDHRTAQERLGDLDAVSQDLFVGHLGELELFQWFVRAHLKDSSGDVSHRSTGAANAKRRVTSPR
jgi:starvation-inducible DNA-binding protein